MDFFNTGLIGKILGINPGAQGFWNAQGWTEHGYDPNRLEGKGVQVLNDPLNHGYQDFTYTDAIDTHNVHNVADKPGFLNNWGHGWGLKNPFNNEDDLAFTMMGLNLINTPRGATFKDISNRLIGGDQIGSGLYHLINPGEEQNPEALNRLRATYGQGPVGTTPRLPAPTIPTNNRGSHVPISNQPGFVSPNKRRRI